MTNKITCKICNCDFKIITSAHVKNHGFTIKQYKDEFGQTVSEDILKSWTIKRTKNKPPKQTLDSTNAVECMICGQFHKALNLHLKYRHQIIPKDYLLQFPNAKLYAESIKNKMKENSAMKGTNKTFEEKFGKEKSDEMKKTLSENAIKNQTGKKRTEEYRQKMRTTWEDKREEWTKSIQISAKRDSVKEKLSIAQKKRIERDGYHLARGRETKLELFIRTIIESAGFEVTKQKGTKKKILGTIRFFDMYIPELNLVIEVDGEWWHKNQDRILIDKAKTEAAIIEGYSFLRLSDKEFGKNKIADPDKEILRLIHLSKDQQLEYSNNIIKRRETI